MNRVISQTLHQCIEVEFRLTKVGVEQDVVIPLTEAGPDCDAAGVRDTRICDQR